MVLWRDPAQLLPLEARPAPQHLAARALTCICEHLGFIIDLFCTTVSKMYPKLSEKPKRSDLGNLDMLKFFFHIS